MRIIWIMGLCALALLQAGCEKGGEKSDDSEDRLLIVATTSMIADAARVIAGDRAEIRGIMGPGVDPHTYKASQQDLQLLSEADIILYNGLHLEGKMGDVLEKLAQRKSVIAIGDFVDESQLRTPPEFKGAHDPHIWFDVAMWKGAIEGLALKLEELDSAGATLYRKNSINYSTILDSLDLWVRTQIQTIPKNQRVLVTAHDAFGYFGRAYDIEVRGLQGISTVSEFGLSDRKAMVDLIVQRKVKAVFVESSVPPRNVEALVEGVKASGHSITIGGQLYSDAMGAEGTPAGTYVGMVRANVEMIVGALR